MRRRRFAACVVRVVVLALLVGAAPAAWARPAEFLAAGDPLEDDVLSLRARGLTDDLAASTRPWVRADVADALVRALAAHPALAGDPVMRRALRRLAREVAESPLPEAANARTIAGEEVAPFLHLGDAHTDARASVFIAPLLRAAPDTSLEWAPGGRGGVRAFVRITPSLVLAEEWHIGRAPAGRHWQGDFLFGLDDFEQDISRAYLAWSAGSWRLWAGRDAPRWGPGLEGTLLLSNTAGPRTQVTATGTLLGRLTATVHTEALSATDGRYLAAHRLEWRATPRLRLGLAETALYRSRSPEPLYWLGFLPYTLVQRAITVDSNADSVALAARNNLQAAADAVWRPTDGLELRAELLVDDLQLGSSAVPSRGGAQVGASWVGPWRGGVGGLHAEYTRVARHTYSVFYSQNGDRDYAFRDQPLGFAGGPGSEDALLRATWDRSRDVQVGFAVQRARSGAEGLGVPWRPGDPRAGTWGFAGPVERRTSIAATLRWERRQNQSCTLGAGYRDTRNTGHIEGRTTRGPIVWWAAEWRK